MATTGLTSQSIPNLMGGISKVSPLMRQANQMEDIDNGYFVGTAGLVKRPPLVMTKTNVKSGLIGTSEPFVFSIDRGDGNEYVGVIAGGSLEIIDVNNPTVAQTITYTNQAYLNPPSGTSREHFRVVTIMDYTLILNTSVVTEFRPYYWTSGNPTAADEDPIHDIVQLFTDLPATSNAHDQKVFEIVGDLTSTLDNYYVKCFHQAVNPEKVYRESRRPNILHTFNNTTLPHALKKTGANSWVFEPVVWNDRLVGDEVSNPTPSFMSKYTRVTNVVPPASRYFTDTKSINRTITDMVYFQDRLVFSSDEFISFSRAGDYFNFWHKSATTLQPDDPIDVSALSQKVSKIHSMTPFSRALILSSTSTQFYLTSNGALTPSTVSITAVTDYDSSVKLKPITIGASLFLPAKQSGYFRLNEYYLYEGQAGYLANNIAESVDTFIPETANSIVGSPISDTLFVHSSNASFRKNIYVYKAEWEDNKKKTSAWARWVFEDNVLGITTIGSKLYVITHRLQSGNNYTYLGYVDLAPSNSLVTPISGQDVSQSGALYEYDIHLDHRETQTLGGSVYDAVSKTSTVTLAALKAPTAGDYSGLLAVVKDSTGEDLVITDKQYVSGNTVLTVSGNLNNEKIYTGIRYQAAFTFSPIYFRGQTGEASTAVKLKLRNIGIAFGYTGTFQVEVTPFKRDTYTYDYSGVQTGAFTIGRMGLTTGHQRFTVMSDSTTAKITIKDSSVFPCSFLSYDWQGMYAKRA